MRIKKEQLTGFLGILRGHINRSSFFNACYGAAMVLVMLGIALGLIHSLLFLGRMFNRILFISNKEISSDITTFDVSTLLSLSSRLGIMIPTASQSASQSLPEPLPASPTPSMSESAQALPANLASFHLQILNHTKITGLAQQWKERFISAGFTNIEIGNIRSGNYRNIHLNYAPHNKQFIEEIKKIILSFQGVIGAEAEDTSLGDTIMIIIGASE